MSEYNHKAIEKKWQDKWAEKGVFKIKDSKPGAENEYILVEFPYPSGNLHVGHWYAFAVTDIYARMRRIMGKNVLFPVGFDAFGLPAENAAIKRKLNPRDWTYSNMEFMEGQLRSMGASFDWDRKIATCDPEYYKWTQWLFLKFYEKGLAYQAETNANWCPSCKTVLANEQVKNGRCERCDNEVFQKKLNQWQFKITEYADRLVDDLDSLNWPEPIKIAQKNWIGRSEGAKINFKIENSTEQIEVFTTRPDTLFGVTYLVLAPEHELVMKLSNLVKNAGEAADYVLQTSKKTEMDRQAETKNKTGVKLEGVMAINPANGESVPIYIADYVLAGYGTGAIMAVPAHDERDYEFAQKFGLPIRQVVDVDISTKKRTEKGILVNSGEFTGMTSDEALKKITEKVGGKLSKNYRLRDWLISRQRYWGCPIPMIHCSKCGAVPVAESDLPIKLPEVDDYLPHEDGKSPLAKATSWVNVKCPKCGGDAERETDTLDTFIDSSWYYLRYVDPRNSEKFADTEKIKSWMPVKFYSGGAEHTTMHLLFARFFYKVMFDLGLVNENEPFVNRLNRGLLLGPDGNKMSKSKGNVIEPDPLVEKVGADTVRMYLAFIGPYNEVGSYPWDPNGVVGMRRFLERVWKISENLSEEMNHEVNVALHKLIKRVGEEFTQLKFNAGIAQLMSFSNLIEKQGISKVGFSNFLKLLSTCTPHICEEMWSNIGNDGMVSEAQWPSFDENVFKGEEIKISVQINGKMRAIIQVTPEISEEELKTKVMILPEIIKWLDGKDVKKTIYVKGRIFSIVV